METLWKWMDRVTYIPWWYRLVFVFHFIIASISIGCNDTLYCLLHAVLGLVWYYSGWKHYLVNLYKKNEDNAMAESLNLMTEKGYNLNEAIEEVMYNLHKRATGEMEEYQEK